MAYIGKPPNTTGKDAGPSLKLDDISSGFNGNTKVFDLTVAGTSVDPHVNNTQIYLSGVHQLPGTAYTLSGSQIVFTAAPSSSLSFHGAMIGDATLFTPNQDTIEPAAFTDNARTALSGSLGVNGSLIRSLNATTISGSFSQAHLSSKISGIVSASVLSSPAQGTIRLATNGVNNDVDSGLQAGDSPTFAGGTVTGNLTVGGTLTAQEIHTEFTSASIMFSSGSTIFGDSSDDVHNMTGSLNISGSFNVKKGDSDFGNGNITTTGDITSKKLTVSTVADEGDAIVVNGADGGRYDVLTVQENGNARFNLSFEGNGSTNDLTLNSNSTNNILNIKPAGLVGIGTDSPTSTSQLHVEAALAEIRIKGTNDSQSDEVAHLIIEGSSDRRAGITIEGDSNALQAFIGRPYDSPNKLVFETSGSERVRIDNAGKVGINENSFPYTDYSVFHIKGRGSLDGNVTGMTFHVGGTNAASRNFSITTNNSAHGSMDFRVSEANNNTPNTNLIMQLSKDAVGIGTNSPDANLDLRGTQKTQTNTVPASLIVGTNDNTDHTAEDSALAIDFRNLSTTNGVAGGLVGLDKDGLELSKILLVTDNHDANTSSIRMFTSTNAAQRTQMVNINNDGVTVGGGSSAQRALHVQGTTGMCLSDGDRDRAALIPLSPDANSGGLVINTRSGGSSVERMRIESDGNVGIGTNNPGFPLEVEKAHNDWLLRLVNSVGSGNAFAQQISFSGVSPNNTAAKFQQFVDGGSTVRFEVRSNGGVASFQSNDADLSDESVKKDIVDASNCLDTINNIKVRNFKYKDQTDDRTLIGVIAQEVEAVNSALVDDSEELKRVYNKDIMFMMLKSIQELSEKNDALEKRIEELEK